MHFLLFIFLSIFSFQAVSSDSLSQQEAKKGFSKYDDSNASHLSQVAEDIQVVLNEGNQTKLEEAIRNINIESYVGPFSQLILLGHQKTLYKKIEEIMRKLVLPGEPDYIFKVSGKPISNAEISPKEKPPDMTIFFGLLALTSNEDELASVIAHEMTHGHTEHLKANIDNPQINEILNAVHGYKDLKASQREEIRADLGVVDRLIKAGYNPWAYYDLLKKMNIVHSKLFQPKILGYINKIIFKRSFEYMSTHPAFEIRSSAIKSYILFKSLREDISEKVKDHKPFDMSMNFLRKKAQIMNVFAENVWMQRLMIPSLSLSALLGVEFILRLNIPIFNAINAFMSSQKGLVITMVYTVFMVDRTLNQSVVGSWSPMIKLERLKKIRKKHNRIVYQFHQEKMMNKSFNPNWFLGILNRNINYLKHIDFICRNSQWLYFLRYRNGLAYSKYRALKNTRRLLEDVSSELFNDPDFLNLVLKKLDELPSFALTDKHLRKTIENLFAIPDIQNIFEYQSSEISSALQRKIAILRVSENITARSSPEERLLTMKYLAENGFFYRS